MLTGLIRVGTIYIPVKEVEVSAKWYEEKIDAVISYIDTDKAIVNFANQSFFLVKSKNTNANFIDFAGNEQFSVTFEVDGLQALLSLHSEFKNKNIQVGDIEDRGHVGKNFVFTDIDGNKFDVWSELSPQFKEKFL
ncbi:VOC family protein [Ureibacillus sp. 179-F W5.1 NHS]|uniref:VOC family protein n=1 Tax=unclassified Ureibacillus TaxID=2638520 RepID=UPI0031198B05